VKPVDKLRDELVREITADYHRLAEEVAALKDKARNDVDAFLDISASRYGEDLGGKKGNVTIYSYDGSLKIVRSVRALMVFDEGLDTAKRLIDQCLTDWTAGGREEVRLIIDRAFRPNSMGHVNTSSVLALRNLAINDERWIRAMTAITDSLKAMNSRDVILVYMRNEDGSWERIREGV
jgi:hypothetical protein